METLEHNGLTYFQYNIKKPSLVILHKLIDVSLNCYISAVLYSQTSDILKKDETFTNNFKNSFKLLLPKQYQKVLLTDINFKKLNKIHLNPFILNSKKYKFCKINKIKYELSNYFVEPLCIFKGRGDHPLRGTIKIPPDPSLVSINLGINSKIPSPPLANSNWGSIIHNPKVSWACFYKDTLGNSKYSFPILNNELNKFQEARTLKSKLPKLRSKILSLCKSDNLRLQQKALAVFLIDKICIRVGHPKELDSADTVGCCTLRCEHFKFLNNNKINLNFIGKDSITFNKSFIVSPIVFNSLKNFTINKKSSEQIFHLIDANSLNTFLNSLHNGLTAKQFRTFHSSNIFCKHLFTFDPSIHNEPIEFFKECNKKIAILCNHKKGNSLSLETSKSNYIDPRIIFAFASTFKLNINQLLSPSLQTKHSWAKDTHSSFRF